MKKITFLLLLITSISFAQQTAEDTNEKREVNFYFGLGAILHPDYNINSNLVDGGVKSISDVTPAAVVGWTTTFKNNLSLSMEFGSTTMWRNRKKDGSQLIQIPASIRLHYLFAKTSKLQFSAGANVSLVASSLSVFSDDTVIDMNNLNPDTNTGYMLFRNSSWFAGPSASLNFLDSAGKTSFTLTAGYDFCFTNSKWKSDYARISNPVKENGGRAFITFGIPFL